MKTNDATTPSGKYAARIKNPAKRRYAWDYLEYLRYGGAEPTAQGRGLTFMAMQAVRLQLHKLEEGTQPYVAGYPNVQAALRCLYACNHMPVNAHDRAPVPAAWLARFQLAESVGKLDDDTLELVCDGDEEDMKAWVLAHGLPGLALSQLLDAAFNGELF